MTVKRGTEEFSGFNKPKKTPDHPTKSHAVLAKDGDKTKLIRFGQQGVSGAGAKPSTPAEKAKGKMSAAYWSDKTKW